MPDLYKYETSELGITTEAIHLLRNRFNYHTIPFSSVTSIEIKKGKEYSNWGILLLVGLIPVCYVLYILPGILQQFSDPKVHTIYLESLYIPAFILVWGIIFTAISFRTTDVMIVSTAGKTYRFSLRSFIRTHVYFAFITDLRTIYPNVSTTNEIDRRILDTVAS